MSQFNRHDRRITHRVAAILFFFLCATSVAKAQTTQVSAAEVKKRVDAILGKMTLDEKLTIIGGINDFYIQAIPRLGLPALRMSDGPLGVHDYGPTTAYPGGISLAASWGHRTCAPCG